MDQHQAGAGPAKNTMAKSLIPCATLYNVEFPDGCDLAANALAKHQFIEPATLDLNTTGFVAVPGTDEFVFSLPQVARVFAVRLADKIIPASVLNERVAKRVAELEELEGRRIGKKEVSTVKDGIADELLVSAFVRHKTVLVLHHLASNLLVIPSTSASVCDRITSLLCHAVGTMRTTTIHVSGLTAGLTARMLAWAQADDMSTQQPMGDVFYLAGDITLKCKLGKAKFSAPELDVAQEGIREALEAGLQVDEIGLQCVNADYEFRLTSDFKFKGIQAGIELEDLEDETDAFSAQVFAELVPLVGVAQQLSELFGFADGEPVPVEAE